MKINLNDKIKVKLTQHGQDIYYQQYSELNNFYHKEISEPRYAQKDSDGYSTFQLWNFINTFGSYIGMGKDNVISPVELIYDESNSK